MLFARFIHNLAIVAAFFVFSMSVQAAANRTFVSTLGNDSHTSQNCGATAPCRSFGAALSVTNSGGEIVVLTSGGYGPASITQAVMITAVGVDASVTATSGDGLDITTTGNVTINGLTLHGMGAAANGINVSSVGLLRLYGITVEKFLGIGVYFQPISGNLAVYDSCLTDNGDAGLFSGGSGTVYVKNTMADNNGYGFDLAAGKSVIEDSVARSNSTAGFFVGNGSHSLIRDDVVQNWVGVMANAGSVQLAYCNITGNTNYAIQVNPGAIVAGSNPGTSVVSGSVSGSLAAAVSLQ